MERNGIHICDRGEKFTHGLRGWKCSLSLGEKGTRLRFNIGKKNGVIMCMGERMKRKRNGKRQRGRNKSNEWLSEEDRRSEWREVCVQRSKRKRGGQRDGEVMDVELKMDQ